MTDLKLSAPCVEEIIDKRFIRLYDIQYAPGKHYYDASRRGPADLAAIKTDDDFREMLPDAVSCFVILKGEEPQLLLSREYRYPAGRYLLSVPAGLLDPKDADTANPVLSAAAREIREETGIQLGDNDSLKVINPCVFSTPGFTDESNALVCAVIDSSWQGKLSQKGAEGSEQFDGFVLPTRSEARQLLAAGRDASGFFFPVYTWMALLYFISGMWEADNTCE